MPCSRLERFELWAIGLLPCHHFARRWKNNLIWDRGAVMPYGVSCPAARSSVIFAMHGIPLRCWRPIWIERFRLRPAVNTLTKRCTTDGRKAVARLIRPGDTVPNVRAERARLAPPSPLHARVWSRTDHSEGCSSRHARSSRNTRMSPSSRRIFDLRYANDSFDAVVAGNVIHLLPEPGDALKRTSLVVRPRHDHRAHLRDSQEAYTMFLSVIPDWRTSRSTDPVSYRALL